MKANILLLSIAMGCFSTSAFTIELPKALTEQLNDSKEEQTVTSNALVTAAASQLGLSEETITSGLGSLFKVAKDNLSTDNFSMLSNAIPDINSYIKQAPTSSLSGVSSLFGSSETTKKAESVAYLDSAFKELGIPTESIPAMVSSVSGYLESNGYGDAAGMLKSGLSFL